MFVSSSKLYETMILSHKHISKKERNFRPFASRNKTIKSEFFKKKYFNRKQLRNDDWLMER